MTQPASVSAVYCDDIRNEVGGKLSLMGVYHNEMLFPTFPAVAPKLGVRIVLKFPFANMPKESLSIELFKDDDLIGNMTFDQKGLAAIPAPAADLERPAEDLNLSMQVMFMFTPFQVDAPCKMRLLAFLDGVEVKGNGLRIRLPTPEERQANGWDSNENREIASLA
jgi:hypothetical protein